MLAAIGALTVVSACGGADRSAGEPAATSESVPAGGSGSGTATSVPDPTTGVPGPSPSTSGGTGFVKGEVSVKLGASAYRVGNVIQVTVHNGMDRPIYTEDFKTACSVVILQRQDGDKWSDILGCQLGRPTTTVTIGPGTERPVELDPASFHLRGNASGPGFGAGTYRVKFTSRVDAVPAGGDPSTVYSPVFTVR